MTHHEHIPVLANELTVENLTGVSVYGPEDEKVGTVGDLLLARQDEVRSAIIDVGGFLGIGAKQVQVPFASLRFVKDSDYGKIHAHIAWTKDELKERPEFIRPEADDDYIFYAPPMM